MSALESNIGFVSGFKIKSVKPEIAADLIPFSKFSLSSKPGSPKHTLESNHPIEICKFSFSMISLVLTLRFLPISLIIPLTI